MTMFIIAAFVAALIAVAAEKLVTRHLTRKAFPTFDNGPAMVLDAPQDAAQFSVDVEKRTVKGLVVPYGVAGRSQGRLFQFAKNSLTFADVRRVKLWVQHKPDQAVGVATKLEETEGGLYGEFSIARGAEGDRILGLVEDGVLDGFSIGLAAEPKFTERDGVRHVSTVPLMEVSLTPAPSFDDARVHSVAASAATGKDDADKGPDFSGIGTEIRKAMMQGFSDLGPREVVPAGRATEVNEPTPYRFDGVRGPHDFSTDLINGLRDGDGEAYQRVMTFMQEAFAPAFDVDRADVTAVNPSRNRPDMYVDRLDYTAPFYNALYKGALTDSTPFVFPKFNTTSGLVGDHTEGTEPTPGAFTATNQTVTPTPVSGMAEITREVWDQGGNPQVSTLIWNEMKRGYFEMLEAKAVAVLTAGAASITDITLTAGAADDDLVDEFEAKLAELQYIRGGNRFNFMGTQIDLYKALAAAKDTTGRKLLPIYGPQNANGVSQRRFSSIEVAGVEATPTWALAASGSVVASSWLLNTADVHVWNSAPQRLSFDYRVAYVDLAIWGYVAAAVSRFDGVREVKYDPVA